MADSWAVLPPAVRNKSPNLTEQSGAAWSPQESEDDDVDVILDADAARDGRGGAGGSSDATVVVAAAAVVVAAAAG